MPELSRAPLSFGQMSLWRAVEDWTFERQRYAIGDFLWDLPDGCSVEAVERALARLMERHEGLRTGYVPGGPQGVEQVTWAQPRLPVSTAELGVSTHDLATDSAAELAGTPFFLDREPAWRARILTRHGRPVALALAVHHIVADGWALDILRRDLMHLLAGREPTPAGPPPREVARRQRSASWARRRASAMAYWRRALEEVHHLPPVVTDGADPRVATYFAKLRASGVSEIAGVLADRLGVTPQTVMLGALCRSIVDRTAEQTIPVMLLAGNRSEPGWRSVVSSFSQVVPLIVRIDRTEGFGVLVRRLQREAMTAYWNGCFDVDERSRIATEYGRTGVLSGFPVMFNYVSGSTPAPSGPPGPAIGRIGQPAYTLEERRTPGLIYGYPMYFTAGNDGDFRLQETSSAADGSATRAHLLAFRAAVLEQL
ncbi:condensation domain-containing protein [Micromonospora sp. NPDC051925]|uniref:condensation domain-containing protein n=1 Tax=Micromonospora sp. NPDC051925 TaxID=3364288 RepID=UPI0037C9D72A